MSSFRGKGKIKPLTCLESHPEFLTAFGNLGNDWKPTLELCTELEAFVCVLYGSKEESSIDKMRLNLFQKKDVAFESLPPNKDCLEQHCMRASYHAAIHRRSLQQVIAAPPPSDHGWIVGKDGGLAYKWMSIDETPPCLSEFVQCSCKETGCVSGNCSCHKQNRPCGKSCSCVKDHCKNRPSETEDEHESDTSDDDTEVCSSDSD